MNIRILLINAFVILSFNAVKAQDPVQSQFFANRSYLNPAFTGIEPGLQLNTTVRNQWLSADKGYTFFAGTAEWQELCLRSGFGVTFTYGMDGIAPVKTLTAGFMYSYIIPTKSGNWHFGLQYSYYDKALNWKDLIFSDQLDPIYGKIYQTVVDPVNESVHFHDFSFGVIRRWDGKVRTRGGSKYSFRSHIGFAIHHLASLIGQGPDESFFHTDSEVPARITLHGGTIIPLEFLTGVGHNITISPNFRFESQGTNPLNFNKSLTLFSGGLYVILFDKLTTGALYNLRVPTTGGKNTNYMTFIAGFSTQDKKTNNDSMYMGLSIDMNATGLGIKSNNIYEFNFKYTFRGWKSYCDWSPNTPKARSHEILKCTNFY